MPSAWQVYPSGGGQLMLTQNNRGENALFTRKSGGFACHQLGRCVLSSGGQLMLTQNTGVKLLFSQERMEALRAINLAGVLLMVGTSSPL